MIVRHKNDGFTLIELMFAMAFVAFILIFIVTAVVHTVRIYNKGLSIRQINQTGRQLTEDITRSLRYSNANSFGNNGYPIDTSVTPNVPYQRLCANGVSYVWNLEGQAGLVRRNTYSDSTEPIKFIRVNDSTGSLCSNPTSQILKSQSRDLLSPQLTVQKFEVTKAEGSRIVTINTIISTQGDNLPLGPGRPTPSGFECANNGGGEFCAFGNFESTVYIRN